MSTQESNASGNDAKSQTLDEEEPDHSQRECTTGTSKIPDIKDEERKKVHFSKRANVKLIPCDQLDAYKPHKSRMLPCEMRRRWVLTKIYQMGGYVRDKAKGRYVYVKPNTPLPQVITRGKEDLLFDSQ
ncbi:hypothetical protein M514_03647 [Trichuris suis]|uniref:Uncharacterized protein n=1 Tax=Trichuris suis TaxID=68888 RepID=A0A085N061_9BILA|nr:hypothetical protein M513_03647 [Trichuris suis]KFD62857.1 hypothetical protein M514_03647 [Trichuris suis]